MRIDKTKREAEDQQCAAEGTEITLDYTGPSMNPTLRAGDGMTVVPYGGNRIRVGDVVVFRSPEQDYYIVHRVFSVDSQGVRTIGDNNNRIDPWVLNPDDIIGRVVSARRRNKNMTIHGGTRGKLLFPALQCMRRANVTFSRILHPAYHWLARSGIFRRTLSPLIKTQFVHFKRPNGVEIQILMGQRLIGRRLPGRDKWQIRRPFRLILDEASLPEGKKAGEPESYPC